MATHHIVDSLLHVVCFVSDSRFDPFCFVGDLLLREINNVDDSPLGIGNALHQLFQLHSVRLHSFHDGLAKPGEQIAQAKDDRRADESREHGNEYAFLRWIDAHFFAHQRLILKKLSKLVDRWRTHFPTVRLFGLKEQQAHHERHNHCRHKHDCSLRPVERVSLELAAYSTN